MEIFLDHPRLLLLLWLLLPLALLLWRAEKKKRQVAQQFLSTRMAARLLPAFPIGRPILRGALLLAGLGCLVVAAARPRFGVYFESSVQRGADIMVLLDVSRSMLSDDVAPSRLERARSDILDVLKRLQTDRVGLTAFAGKPVLLCPLTTDYGYFRQMLQKAVPGVAPVGGTAVGDAIRYGLRAMEVRNDRDQALLLITDGEDQESFPLDAAAVAGERKVKVFTVGLGDSEQGSRIPVTSAAGDRTFLKHDGQEVWSRMDESLLQQIAVSTGGAYVPARTTAYDLGQVYEEHLQKLTAGEIRADTRKRYRDRFQLFLAAGLALLLAEMFVFPYPRQRGSIVKVTRTAALWLLLGVGLTPGAVARGVSDQVEEGIELWRQGNYSEALARFEEALEQDPENPILQFNRGVAEHAAEDREQARTAYLAAAAARPSEVTARSHYNLGMLAAEEARELFGEHPEDAGEDARKNGVSLLEAAILQYRTCLDLQPDHEAARHNLELLRQWIKYMADVWAKRDRDERRQEMDLIRFLTYLMEQQEALRTAVTPLLRLPDSPQVRVMLNELERRQELLAEEIPALDEKIQQSLSPPPPQHATGGPPSPAPALDEQTQQAIQWLLQQTAAARAAMQAAANHLRAAEAGPAREQQTLGYDHLESLWSLLVPFDQALTTGVEVERALAHGTDERIDAEEPVPTAPMGSAPPAPGSPAPSLKERVNWFTEAVRRQDRVGRIAEVLPAKGEAMVAQLQAMQQQQQAQLPPQQPGAPPAPGGAPPAPPAGGDDEGPGELTPEQQLEALQQAVQKAHELSPQIVELCQLASKDLGEEDAASAVVRERKALELLEQIQDLLPKSPEEEKGDDSGEDPGDQGEQKPEEEEQDPGEQDDSGDQGEQPQEQPQMSREEAQALLRRALEREQEAEDKRQELEALIGAPVKVDRDW